MPLRNSEIAKKFERAGDFLEIKGANSFRIRAYREAARVINSLSKSAVSMIEQGEDLSKLKGMGKDLAGKVKEIVETGEMKMIKDLKKEVPEGLVEIMDVSGLGGKRVKKLHDKLDIKSLKGLEKAAKNGKIRGLEGFGEKTEKNILEEIKRVKGSRGRIKISEAEEIAAPLYEYLKKGESVTELEIAGSYRRKKETVGDLDILAVCKKGSGIMDRFAEYEDVKKVIAKGQTKSSVLLVSGLQVDLRVLSKKSYGAALHYFTGSKEHNIQIRKRGVKKGWKINEYGIFKGKKQIAGKTEKGIYSKFGMKYIAPELRENRGEIEASLKDKLPRLVKVNDIRGDLHTHSTYTDGHNTIMEMAKAAEKAGYEYHGVSDHSKKVTVANGLNEKRLREQMDEIDKLNKRLKKIKILKSIEVDIFEDGSLDLPDSVLKELDYTICAVHSKFGLSGKKQTERVLKAMDNKYFNILAHPTGRMINQRAPYEIDMEKIIKEAKKKNCVIEINSHPERLDMDNTYCKTAVEAGLKIAVNTDSHSTRDLYYIKYGVGQARRGWAEKKDVINTYTLAKLKKVFKRR